MSHTNNMEEITKKETEIVHARSNVENGLTVKKTIFDRARLILQTILMFFSLFLVFKLIDYIDLRYKKESKPSSSDFTIKHGSENHNVKAEKFNCLGANFFRDIPYYGKKDVFRQIVSDMTKIIITTKKLTDEELARNFKATSRNYLFSGPPGTGKTQFMKALAYKLNKNLAEYYKEEKTKDLVGTLLISPSTIHSKYHGETEQNIRSLFNEARSNDFKATFIFLDEIDAHFSIRTDESHDYNTRHKTEFLNLMSGISEDMRSNTFIIGASNRHDSIDPAFIRRMGTHITFDAPDSAEIKQILDEITKNWQKDSLSEELLIRCAEILAEKGASHAFLSEITSKLMFRYEDEQENLFGKLYDALMSCPGDKPLSLSCIDLKPSGTTDKYIFTDDL